MRSLMLALTAALLTGCGTTQQATETVKSRWIGQAADGFFAQHGAPKRSYAMQSGGKVFTWETLAMPSGTRTQLVCSADIVTDARGMIREIRLLEDSIGHWNTSRCAEIFQR